MSELVDNPIKLIPVTIEEELSSSRARHCSLKSQLSSFMFQTHKTIETRSAAKLFPLGPGRQPTASPPLERVIGRNFSSIQDSRSCRTLLVSFPTRKSSVRISPQ